MRVTLMTKVGWVLKSRKLTPRFIGPYQILKRVSKGSYHVALPPSLSNLHSVFHVSQLCKYVPDPSHVIQLDHVQIRDNLTYKASPLQIEDREVKNLRGKEIHLVKVMWGRLVEGSMTWELEIHMKESYPDLFISGKKNPGQKFNKWGIIVTPQKIYLDCIP